MDKYIDIIIPRGGMGLIEYIMSKSRCSSKQVFVILIFIVRLKKWQKNRAAKMPMGICGATEVYWLIRRSYCLITCYFG